MTDKVKTPRGPHLEKVLNRLAQGCSKIVFGPLPVYLDPEDTLNNQTLEANITSFMWSGAMAGFSKSKFMGVEIQVPNSQVNENQEFTVEFVVDEDLDNYTLFRRWVDLYRSTENRLDSNNDYESGSIRIWDAQRAYCDFVDVWIVNNMNWPTAIIRYEHVFCSGIGAVTMNFATGEEVKSTATFLYNRARVIRNPSDIEDIVHSTLLT